MNDDPVDAPFVRMMREVFLPLSVLQTKLGSGRPSVKTGYDKIVGATQLVDYLDVSDEDLAAYLKHAETYGLSQDAKAIRRAIHVCSAPASGAPGPKLIELDGLLQAQLTESMMWYNAFSEPSRVLSDNDILDMYTWHRGAAILAELRTHDLSRVFRADDPVAMRLAALRIVDATDDHDLAALQILRLCSDRQLIDVFVSYVGAVFMQKFVRSSRPSRPIQDDAAVFVAVRDVLAKSKVDFDKHKPTPPTAAKILDVFLRKKMSEVDIVDAIRASGMVGTATHTALQYVTAVNITTCTVEIHGRNRYRYLLPNNTQKMTVVASGTMTLHLVDTVKDRQFTVSLRAELDANHAIDAENKVSVTRVERVLSRVPPSGDIMTTLLVKLASLSDTRINNSDMLACVCNGGALTPPQVVNVVNAMKHTAHDMYKQYCARVKQMSKDARWASYLHDAGIR